MTDEPCKADWQKAVAETNRLQRELDITNADHIALWIGANTIPDEPMSQCASWLACRIVEAHEKAQATRIEALEAALRDAAKAERDRLRKLPDDVLLRAMDSFNNGLINKPDASNPRGFVTYYDPLQASKNLVADLADALESKP